MSAKNKELIKKINDAFSDDNSDFILNHLDDAVKWKYCWYSQNKWEKRFHKSNGNDGDRKFSGY